MEESLATPDRKTFGRSSSGSFAHRVFSFPVLLGMLLLVITVAGRYINIDGSSVHTGVASNISFEGDTWWHLAVGNHILQTGHFPTADTYSFTAHGTPWVAYEWFGEVVMALAFRLGGLQGLFFLLLIMCGGFALLTYYYACQRCRNDMAVFLACIILLPLSYFFFTLRPQMLGYCFLIITLIALEKFREGHSKALWLLPGLFLVWVNTHGNFVFGFFFIAIYWASGLRTFNFKHIHAKQWSGSQRRKLELVFLLSLLASMVTPYGTRLAAYPLEMAIRQSMVIRTITEWFPIRADTLEGVLFFAVLLLFALYLLRAKPDFRLEEVAIFSFATFETMAHVRFLMLFVPVFAPLLARALSEWFPAGKKNPDRPVFNAILLCVLVVILAVYFPSRREINRAIAYNFPVSAVAYLSHHHIPDHMLNELDWGGYLTWSMTPKHQVFIDGRDDIYDYAGVLSDYLAIMRGSKRTFFLLRKYDVHSCLIRRGNLLANLLAASRGWREIYHNRISVIFVKLGKRTVASARNSEHGGRLSTR